MLWTVVRFPNGSWSTGGRPDSPEYSECEIWQIEADNREQATRKAKAKRSYAAKKASAPIKRCAAARDGDCTHAQCPQLRDNEPHASGRHCPLDTRGDYE